MITIADGEALPRALDPYLRELITLRVSQLRRNYDGPLNEIVCFYVVEAGDSQEQVAEALGFSPLKNVVDGTEFGDPDFTPSFETISCYGDLFEIVYIFTDDGFAQVLLVPNDPSTEFDLHMFCLSFGCPEND
jgi:hypothetical protein